MEDLFTRVWENMGARLSGPLQFRLLLQPLMAAIFATQAGLRDAREKRPPYFWSIFTNPAQRKELVAEGWEAVGKVFVIALIIDAVFQFIVFRWFYPGEALIVAIFLAILPYLAIRGLVNRLVRLMQRPASLPHGEGKKK